MLDGLSNWHTYEKGSLLVLSIGTVQVSDKTIFFLVKYCLVNYVISVHGNPVWLKSLTPAVELIASDQPHLTFVLGSVWMHSVHRKLAEINRKGIRLSDWMTRTGGWTVLCTALWVWGQCRSLMTSSMEHTIKRMCSTNSGPSQDWPQRSPLLVQCRYNENISWGHITTVILKDCFCSAWHSCCLIHSSHVAPLALVLRFPKSKLQHFVFQISLWISNDFTSSVFH